MFSHLWSGQTPELDQLNIYVWDRNYYALEVTTRLGLEGSGDMVRVGPVHNNTVEEIEKFGEDCLKQRFVLAYFASALLENYSGSQISRKGSFWIIIDTFAGNFAL
jgi:hypothetical protein